MPATPDDFINRHAQLNIEKLIDRINSLEGNDYFRPTTAEGEIVGYTPTDAELNSILGNAIAYNGNTVGLVINNINDVPYFVFGDNNKWYFVKLNDSTNVACGARVWSSIDINIPNAVYTAVPFDSGDFDMDNFYSAGNPTRLTVPEAGIYSISANIRWTTNAVGIRGLRLLRNGVSLLSAMTVPTVSGQASDVYISTVQGLSPTEFVEVYAYQSSGGVLAIDAVGGLGAALPWFSIHRVY